MSWNWAHTKRKQKEMAEKSASYQQGLKGVKPLYRELGCSKPQNTTKWYEERARERRMKIITIVMLSLMSMVFITTIAYFITYGV